ncbi:sugar phosphate isomerase/epimerase family protein [Candidatus Latescibacterota bacterium]
MSKSSRRNFIRTSAAGVAVAVSGIPMAGYAADNSVIPSIQAASFRFGMASYTFRKFGLDETIAMTKKLGLERIALKDFHLAMDSTEAEIRAVAAKVKDAGLELYGCGVVYMTNESEVIRAFDYAKAADMELIIGVPEHNLLELVEKKVSEYDIKLAIHNHGPGDERYPSAESAYERIKDMDPRMGLCLDIGHTQRIGIDPSESAERFFDRLHDVHIKDVSDSSEKGSTVEIGRGVIDIPKFLRTLKRLGYTGTVALEYEKDADDPYPGSAESIGYLKGVLSVI